MANVDSIKAQKILMYLWAQGFKYKEMATEAGLGLGWDIINYLKSAGHTLDADAEKRLACDGDKKSFSPVGIGIAGNTYSEIVGIPWQANDPIVAETFGMSAFAVDTYFGIGILKLGLDPAKVKAGVVGGGMNYGGRNVKPSNGFNRTGWDLININQIAESGKVDSNWVVEVNSGTMAKVSNSKYEVGSGLATFGATLPTPIPSGVAAPTPTATAAPAADPTPVAPATATPATSKSSDFDEYLETDDLSIWWKNGLPIPVIDSSDREVSSKAWTSKTGKIPVPKDSPILIEFATSDKESFVLESLQTLVSIGELTDAEFANIITDSVSNTKVVKDDDGGEWDVVVTPECHIVIHKGKVFFGITGFGMIPATQNGEVLEYSKATIVMDEPSSGGTITDVLVDGISIQDLITNQGVYGFPYDGFNGLENRFKAGNYTDDGASKSAEDQATQALSKAYLEGYRKITYNADMEKANIFFDKSTLPEDLLQPLALDFDTELNLDTEAVYFTLLFSSSRDASNIFTGFDINNTTDNNEQAFLFPFDIRNLRPVNESKLVMDPKGRKEGEGIKSIRVASKDGKSGGVLEISSKTYDVIEYSQIEMTDDDGNIILIPDSDERFEALDNQSSEIKGTVETRAGRPAMLVIKGALDIADIEKHMTNARRSQRLSTKYNSKNDVTGKIDTKTIMVQQGSDYYLIVGDGSTTYAIKIRGD